MTGAAAGDGKFADLRTRVIAAIAFALIGAAAIWLGGWWGVAFVMVAGGVMAWEWRSISQKRDEPVVAGFQIAAVAGASLLAFLSDFDTALVFLLVVAAAGACADAYLKRPIWWSFLGSLYIGISLAFLVIIREEPTQGFIAVVWLVLIVVATDVGAYFAGRLIGGPKLWPRVSPGKTWAGAIGGAVFAAIVAWAIGAAAGRPLAFGAEAAAVIISIVSQIGDLVESAYKRRFGVKDSGRIMPGHGGALDRLDGLLAASLAVGMMAALRPDAPVWAW